MDAKLIPSPDGKTVTIRLPDSPEHYDPSTGKLYHQLSVATADLLAAISAVFGVTITKSKGA